mmetsp:Transcript_17826/g.33863  ORF Transcript_17826/g.33863 Transcript_17826/m.33863 type:complete len:80 (-) Transcript_17826:44-283(-)
MGNMRFSCDGRGKARIKLTGSVVLGTTAPGTAGGGATKSCKVICIDPGGLPFPNGSAFLTLPSGIHWMVAMSVTMPAWG